MKSESAAGFDKEIVKLPNLDVQEPTVPERLDFEAYGQALYAFGQILGEQEISSEEMELYMQILNTHEEQFTKALNDEDLFQSLMHNLAKILQLPDLRGPTDYTKLKEWCMAFITKNSAVLENNISSRNVDEQAALAALGSLSMHGKDEYKAIGTHLLRKHADAIEEGLTTEDQRLYYLTPAEAVVHHGSPEQADRILDAVTQLLHTDISETELRDFLDVLKYERNTIERLFAEALDADLSSYNLSSKKLVEAWLDSACIEDESEYDYNLREFNPFKIIQKNLAVIENLEMKDAGITKILQRKFGLNSLARYPEELLVKQFHDAQKPNNKPYGVYIVSHHDHTGAWYAYPEAFQQLNENLENKYNLRFIECRNRAEVYSRLLYLYKNYGAISFAGLMAHGSSKGIEIHPDDPLGYVHSHELDGKKEDLMMKALAKMQQFFVSHPHIIMHGCGVGDKNGPARRISQKLEAKVLSVTKDTGIEWIKAKLRSGSLAGFDLELEDPEALAVFDRGKRTK